MDCRVGIPPRNDEGWDEDRLNNNYENKNIKDRKVGGGRATWSVGYYYAYWLFFPKWSGANNKFPSENVVGSV